MNNQAESHVLVIHEQAEAEPRRVLLQSATHSIGRDKRNSIMISSHIISRQHALLLRMPNAERGSYRYRILDGDSMGKPSLNGISVNGTRCSTYDLSDGDFILLGNQIRIEYQILSIASNEKYFDYLNIQVPKHQSIRVQPESAKSTMSKPQVAVELEPPPAQHWADDVIPTQLFRK
jgi:pSer/pThr/pTyr-binding forkhead associated (FHA) protein